MMAGFDASPYEIGLATDFSVNSPKLRLSAMGYLLDNGALTVDLTVDELLAYAEAFVQFVAGNNAEFLTELQALASDAPAPIITDAVFEDEPKGYL